MDLKEIQALIKFVAKSGAQEVSLETEDFKINIKTGSDAEQPTIIQAMAPQAPVAMAAAPAPAAPAPAAPAPEAPAPAPLAPAPDPLAPAELELPAPCVPLEEPLPDPLCSSAEYASPGART